MNINGNICLTSIYTYITIQMFDRVHDWAGLADSLLCTLHPGIQWMRLHLTGDDWTGLCLDYSLSEVK